MDRKELKGRIVAKGMTHAEVAAAIGMSLSTFGRKMKHGTFGLDEADRLIAVLEIKNPEEIFFARK